MVNLRYISYEEKYEEYDEYLLDMYVLNIEKKSNHPISQALINHIKHKYDNILHLNDISIKNLGKGISAKYKEEDIKIGNAKYLNVRKERN